MQDDSGTLTKSGILAVVESQVHKLSTGSRMTAGNLPIQCKCQPRADSHTAALVYTASGTDIQLAITELSPIRVSKDMLTQFCAAELTDGDELA
jgi:hypothetical protein